MRVVFPQVKEPELVKAKDIPVGRFFHFHTNPDMLYLRVADGVIVFENRSLPGFRLLDHLNQSAVWVLLPEDFWVTVGGPS